MPAADFIVDVTPSMKRELESLDGNAFERALTFAAQRKDPSIKRVHVHADEVLVEYEGRDYVHRFERLVFDLEGEA